MLVGAVASFIVAAKTHSPWLGVAIGALAGAALALVFAVLALSLRANQVATGLALSLFGVGLSAFVGRPYMSVVIEGMKPLKIPVLSDLPVVGKLLFAHGPLVYASIALFALVHVFLSRTRAGLGGAFLAVAYTPAWVEGMTAGRGWIALALVVFATWKPWRVMVGAYLFGSVTLAQFQAQAAGVALSSQLLAMLPYVATIIVLAIISRDATMIRLNAPASLGKPYHPG
jgi:simple sugar transport system permease protein